MDNVNGYINLNHITSANYILKIFKNLFTYFHIMLRNLFYFFIPLSAFALRLTTSNNGTPRPVKIRGSTKPLELFDPLNFAEKGERLTFLREAELKHGRIAMMSSILIPFFDRMDPNVLGIHGFDHLDTNTKLLIIAHMFMAEFASIFKGWENPIEKPFTLKPFYQPGDLGFKTPIKISEEEYDTLMDKELNNGRLAMIGTFGMIAQELITQQPLF